MELTEQQIREKLAEKAKARGQVLPSQNQGESLVEKFGFAKATATPSTPAPTPSLRERLSSFGGQALDFGKEVGKEIIEAPGKLGETAVQSLDVVAKPVGEFLGKQIKGTALEGPLKATKPFVEAVTEPQFDVIQTPKEAAGEVIKTAATIAPVGRAANFIKNIGEAATVGGLYNLGTALEEDKGVGDTVFDVGQGALTIGGLVGTLGLIGKGAERLLTPAETLVKNKITELYNKAVKPTITGKGTAQQVEKYQDNVLSGVQSIMENKPSLKFTDEYGEVIQGQAPKSLQQASEAIDQTKKKIFEQYDALAKKAGESGAMVPTQPVIDELATIINNKSVALANPKAINYAKELMDRLAQKDAQGNIIGYETLTPSEAQDVVQHLNQSLQAFYKNPTYDTATQAGIDALFANKLRTGLDESISNLSGAYQGLKNEYGALSSIEKDVVKASLRDARKNIKGLIDFSDVLSGGELVSGILSMNPASIAKAGVMKGVSEYIKYLNNPNRIISKVFQSAEKLPPRIKAVPGALEEIGQKVPNQSPNTNLLSKNPSPTSASAESINNIPETLPQVTSKGNTLPTKEVKAALPKKNKLFYDYSDELQKRIDEGRAQGKRYDTEDDFMRDFPDFYKEYKAKSAEFDTLKNTIQQYKDDAWADLYKLRADFEAGKFPEETAQTLEKKFLDKWEHFKTLDKLSGGLNIDEYYAVKNGKLVDLWKESTKNATKNVEKSISKELQPLAEEARKYKSAEDFINAQEGKYYHGGEKIDEYKNIGKGGVYLTPDLEMADIHKKFINWKTKGERQGVINEGFVKPKKTLILNEDQVDIIEAPDFYKKAIENIKKDGYDSMMSHDKKQLFVFDATKVKTKAQLEDIWKQANQFSD